KEFEGKEVPAEKRAELKKLHDAGMALKAEIEVEKEQAAETKDMGDLSNFLERPMPTVALPLGPSSRGDGVKSLAARGWELKAGYWHAPTSIGKAVPMYADDVLFGDDPAGASGEERAYRRSARAAVQPIYATAYKNLLFRTAKFRDYSQAWSSLSGVEQKALSEGTDTAGGFTVPPDDQAELLVRKANKALFRRLGARVQPTSRDVLRFPTIQAAS